MDTDLKALQALYQQHANPDNAASMQRYMRDQFEFLGIKSPQANALFKQWVADHGLPEVDRLETVIRALWAWPEREYQYVALTLLDKRQKSLTPAMVPLLEHLIITKSWWDTVDAIASHNVGKLLRQYPDHRDRVIAPWSASENLWLRRTTLLFQLGYKAATDEQLLFTLVRANRDSSEFFIQPEFDKKWSTKRKAKD
jgi:3-methyladenine DNA glycosylase AlkD